MIVYFDASAFVKLLVAEDESPSATELWNRCDAAFSSRLGYPEVRAALAAAERGKRLTAGAWAEATRTWERVWMTVGVVELSAGVAKQGGELARQHDLSGADAVHLASALAVGGDELRFASWDQRLRTGAASAGLAVVPNR